MIEKGHSQFLQTHRTDHHLKGVRVGKVKVRSQTWVKLINSKAYVDTTARPFIYEVDIVFITQLDKSLEIEGIFEIDYCFLIKVLGLIVVDSLKQFSLQNR